MVEILRYIDGSGRDVVGDWLSELRDSRARAKIAARYHRLEHGNFGDCRRLRDGVCELKIDYGPGYRIYYAMLGQVCVLLLCGGDKRTQAADINRAVENLRDFERRRSHET